MKSPITTRTALLLALAAGPGFGLELIERVHRITSGVVKLHQGNVYPELRRLERAALVASRVGDPQPERGGRARRSYRITARGDEAARIIAQAIGNLIRAV